MRRVRLYTHRPVAPSMFDPTMPGSIFDSPRVERVDSPLEADWCVCARLKPLLPIIAARPRGNYMVWTNEPRHSRTTRRKLRLPGGTTFAFMNVYTGDVFWHNHHFVGSVHCDTRLSLGLPVDTSLPRALSNDLLRRRSRPPVVAIWLYVPYQTRWVVEGMDRDLERLRRDCALAGVRRGIVDIYGAGWPGGVSRPFAGYPAAPDGTPWWTTKIDLMRDYRFNLCVESTNYSYFCTEKIWQSVVAGCLPIYWGKGNRIYESFPAESFLDLADYATPDDLFDHVEHMGDEEYLRRLNLCIEAYNQACRSRQKAVENEPGEHRHRVLSQLGLSDD